MNNIKDIPENAKSLYFSNKAYWKFIHSAEFINLLEIYRDSEAAIGKTFSDPKDIKKNEVWINTLDEALSCLKTLEGRTDPALLRQLCANFFNKDVVVYGGTLKTSEGEFSILPEDGFLVY